MKIHFTLFLVVGIILSCTLFAGNSFATWANCKVAKAGYYGPASTNRVRLINCNVDPSNGKNGWVSLNSKGSYEMLAAALTAVSLEHSVGVEFNGTKDSQGYNILISLFAINQ